MKQYLKDIKEVLQESGRDIKREMIGTGLPIAIFVVFSLLLLSIGELLYRFLG